MTNEQKETLTAVTLSAMEWKLVTAALLCLQDQDDNRNNAKGAVETEVLRKKIRKAVWG